MTRTGKRVLIVVVIVAVLAATIAWLSRPAAVAVTVEQVSRGRVEATVANTRAGTVKACRRAGLSPSTGGQIARLLVKRGDAVKAGQLLLALRNDDLEAQLDLARRDGEAARARAESVCLQADSAERDSQRLTELGKSRLVAEEQVDQAQTRARTTRAECSAARAQVEVAQARLEVARATLDHTLLRAPFSGVVAEINGELNEYVTPSPPGIATLPVIDLIDGSCVYITAPIDEVDAHAIRPGMPARISLDAFGDKKFAGRVRRIADYVQEREKQARTVDVEIDLVDPKQFDRLIVGYSADAEIILATRDDVLRIPTLAVIDSKRVLVYNPRSGKLEAREIQPGLANWEVTEVVSGLAEGERVVTSLDRAGVKAGVHATVEAKAKP